jgi:hypothetical protein
MTEPEPLMICYACGRHIPDSEPTYPGVRRFRVGKKWRSKPDKIVVCHNESAHPPYSEYNWVSLAQARGQGYLDRLQIQKKLEARMAREAKK